MQIVEGKFLDETADFMAQTIGFFDGVHLGHRYLLEQVREEAQRRSLKSMAITFRQHPRKVLHPEDSMPLLTSLDEKLQLLSDAGLDYVALLDFTPELSQMSAKEFMEQYLCRKLRGKSLIIGYDHHFGRRSNEGFADYHRYGTLMGLEVIQARELPAEEASHASSTSARKALQQGDIATANAILGRPYTLCGTVAHGQAIGRSIGFPTANISPICPDKIVPQNGVYAVRVSLRNRTQNGMLYIGNRPTINRTTEQRIEVNIFDFNEEIYQQTLTLEFIARIRGEQRFLSLDKLHQQLNKDQLTAKKILSRSS